MHNYAINHGLDWASFPATESVAQRDVNFDMVNTDTTPAGHDKRNAIAASL